MILVAWTIFWDHFVEIRPKIVSLAGPRSPAKGQKVGRVSSHERRDTPEIPRYVFRRVNGSYRYKRNVLKGPRQLIGKDTLYWQLG